MLVLVLVLVLDGMSSLSSNFVSWSNMRPVWNSTYVPGLHLTAIEGRRRCGCLIRIEHEHEHEYEHEKPAFLDVGAN